MARVIREPSPLILTPIIEIVSVWTKGIVVVIVVVDCPLVDDAWLLNAIVPATVTPLTYSEVLHDVILFVVHAYDTSKLISNVPDVFIVITPAVYE